MRNLSNSVQLIGNIGIDPEMKTFENNNKTTKFTLATNQVYYDNRGEKTEETQWHTIVAWGKLAETCEKYLKKGMSVAVDGKIVYRQWEDKDGKKNYTTEIVIGEMLMLGKKEQ